MLSNVLTIDEVFSKRMLRVPDYQRGYAWEESHCRDLIQDLEMLPANKEHYTGTLVLHGSEHGPVFDEEGNKYDVFDIVDGQQRLTSIVVLLDALRREMARIASLSKLCEGLGKKYISVKNRAGQDTFKLRLNSDCDEYWIRNILSEVPGLEGATIASHRRLDDARRCFSSFLAGKRALLANDFKNWLEAMHLKITQQLKLTLYEVSQESDVGVIFEVMNNRGKPLSELEKAKNYLLYLSTKIPLEDHGLEKAVNGSWAKIYRSLMAGHLTDTAEENRLLRVHWTFAYDPEQKKWQGVKSIKDRFRIQNGDVDFRRLVEDLREYALGLEQTSIAFRDAMNPSYSESFMFWEASGLRRRIVLANERLRRVNVVAPFLPLLVAMRLRFPEEPEKYLELVELCELFAFRVYRLIEKRANTGQPALRRTAFDLFHERIAFQEASDKIAGALLWYCPDQVFHSRFDLREDKNDWYSWRGLKYFLYEYEAHLAGKNEPKFAWDYFEKSDPGKTVEHILPQTPSNEYWVKRFSEDAIERWTHDIANLTLTKDNSSYGNKAFPDKKGKPDSSDPCYATSGLYMERRLATFQDWDTESLVSRRKDIVNWALSRWHVNAPALVPPDGDYAEEEEEE